MSISDTWTCLFSNEIENRGLSAKCFEQVPSPPGARATEGDTWCTKQKNTTQILNEVKNRPIHVFAHRYKSRFKEPSFEQGREVGVKHRSISLHEMWDLILVTLDDVARYKCLECLVH